MRTFTLLFSAFVLGTTATQAQSVATFDTLHLSKADTFYVNYSAPGSDVGFDDGHAHFPCIYDTSYGGIWSTGFAYSNMADSVTSGYTNEYSAKPATGYGGSGNYAAVFCSDPVTFENKVRIKLTGAAKQVKGFYATNSTYAYNSMRDGDFFAKKFTNGDWYLLSVKGYSGGVLQPTTVGIYLADFLFPDPTKNFILDSWQWVNLLPLGNVDSIELSLTSSDNGMYGMNTPAYFDIDNFTTSDSVTTIVSPPSLAVSNATTAVAKMYPNPAGNMLYVDLADNTIQQLTIRTITGSTVLTAAAAAGHNGINTSTLPAGAYLLQLSGAAHTTTTRFIKN